MNILITDSTVNDRATSANANANMSSYRVSGAAASQQAAVNTEPETIKEMGQRVAAENTPVYMISISSQGRAALQSMQSLSKIENENFNAIRESADERLEVSGQRKEDTAENTEDNVIAAPNNTGMVVRTAEPAEETVRTDSEVSSTRSSGMNLGMYSETQLRSLAREGAITTAQLNNEMISRAEEEFVTQDSEEIAEEIAQQQEEEVIPPVVEQAIAAYTFQMSISNGLVSV